MIWGLDFALFHFWFFVWERVHLLSGWTGGRGSARDACGAGTGMDGWGGGLERCDVSGDM